MRYEAALLVNGKASPLRLCAPTYDEKEVGRVALAASNAHKRDTVVVLANTDEIVQIFLYQPPEPKPKDTKVADLGESVLSMQPDKRHRTAFLLAVLASGVASVSLDVTREKINHAHAARTVRHLLMGITDAQFRVFVTEYTQLVLDSPTHL